MLPYSTDAWLQAVARMNAELAIFVAIAMLLGVFVLALTWWPALADHKGPKAIDRRVCLTLAAGWLAAGAVFYGQYLEPLFFAAPWFMAGYLAQAIILLALAIYYPLPAAPHVNTLVWLGRLAMLYALVVLPLLDLLLGPGWPAVRFLGLAPEPTVLFTSGWLLTRAPRLQVSLAAALPAVAALAVGYSAWALGWAIDLVVVVIALIALLQVPVQQLRAADH